MKRTTRKIMALMLMVTMVFGSFGFAFAEEGGAVTNGAKFVDMPQDWSTAALNHAVANGLISGSDSASGKVIRPNANLTRGEMATIVNRAFGATEQGSLASFSDVPANAWYAPEMAKALVMGTFAGSDGKMRPTDAITRQEAFVVLARAFQAEGTGSGLSKFSDASSIASWAKGAIGGLVEKGSVAGSNGKLNPTTNITRAEFAQVMDNMVQQYFTVAGKYTSVSTGTILINTPGVTLSNVTVTGDLIIGDGVGEGDVTLDNVLVKGTTVIRGGGANSIYITGSTNLGKVIVCKTASGKISIKVSGNATVNITGKVDTILVAGNAKVYLLTGSSVSNVENNGTNPITLDPGVKTPLITGSNTTVVILKESTPPATSGSGVTGGGGGGGNGGNGGGETPAVKEDTNPLKVTRTGYELQDYTITFKSANTSNIKNNVLFYSTVGAVDIDSEYNTLDDQEVATLVEQGKALSLGTGATITAKLPATLKAINGHRFDQSEKYNIYYIFVASISNSGDIDITKADLMIHPERGPEVLTSIGAGPGKGAVVPAGGSTSMSKTSGTFVQAYIDNMKKNTSNVSLETPRIAVFSASWQETEDLQYDDFYNEGDKENFESHGMEPVYIPLALDNYKSITNEQYFADLVESCHIAFFFGGAQLRHTRTLLNDDGTLSKVGDAIQNVLAKGGTVAGSSAGSAVMSGFSYTDGANYSYQPMYWNDTQLVDFAKYDGETDKEPVAVKKGNSLYYKSIDVIEPAAGKDALMDSHFDMRGRLGRLLIAMRDTDPTGLAIGPDEGTGIRITEGVGTVFGLGGVYIVDAANASWSSGKGTSNPFSVTGIKLHYLTEGDTYDFGTGVVTPKSGKTEIIESATTPYKTNDAFGAYETSKTILSLANSTASSVTVKAKKAPDITFVEGPTFDITYTKGNGTAAYVDSSSTYNKGAIKDYLTSYQKTTITNLVMDVELGRHLPLVTHISNTVTSASIEFNNPLMINGVTDGSIYTVGLDTTAYIQIKGNDDTPKAISEDSSFEIVHGNVLKVELANDSFERGDTIQIMDTVKDIYGESVNEDIIFWYSGTKWLSPLKVTDVYKSGSKAYRVFLEFSNEIAIGYTDAADDNYFIDPKSSATEKAKYIVVKDSLGNVKALDNSNSFWLDPEYPKEIMIDLDTEVFVSGDTITIKTTIVDIFGEGIVEDLTYSFNGSKWTLN